MGSRQEHRLSRTHEDARTNSVWLALTAGLVIVLYGCGSSSAQQSSTPPAAKTESGQQATHQANKPRSERASSRRGSVRKHRLDLPGHYGGLGASRAAFKQQNNVTATPQPVPGVATYHVDATDAAGRVLAFSVQINAKPAMDNLARMGLVQGIDFPNDRVPIKDGPTCEIIASRTLERMIGRRYARVTTVTGSDTAAIAAVKTPTC